MPIEGFSPLSSQTLLEESSKVLLEGGFRWEEGDSGGCVADRSLFPDKSEESLSRAVSRRGRVEGSAISLNELAGTYGISFGELCPGGGLNWQAEQLVPIEECREDESAGDCTEDAEGRFSAHDERGDPNRLRFFEGRPEEAVRLQALFRGEDRIRTIIVQRVDVSDRNKRLEIDASPRRREEVLNLIIRNDDRLAVGSDIPAGHRIAGDYHPIAFAHELFSDAPPIDIVNFVELHFTVTYDRSEGHRNGDEAKAD